MKASVIALLVLGAAGCGPGLAGHNPSEIARQESKQRARQAFVQRLQDPASTQAMLRESVVNGGLWFDDPACAAKFPIGEIEPARFGAFAQCLAALKLAVSTREDALGDVTVLTYGPGFELQARVIDENAGPRLSWIGFAGRRDDADNAPTITAAALETMRTAGDAHGPLDASVMRALDGELSPKLTSVHAWLKVCLDEAGAVSAVHPFEATTLATQNSFLAAAKAWTFHPFMRLGRPVSVCSMVRMVHPAKEASVAEVLPLAPPPMTADRAMVMVPPTSLELRRTAGTKMAVPEDETKVEIMQAKVTRLTGTFRFCVDARGAVESVVPLRVTGFPAYDRKILAVMRAWRYTPVIVDGKPIVVCSAVTFIYTQR